MIKYGRVISPFCNIYIAYLIKYMDNFNCLLYFHSNYLIFNLINDNVISSE
jgi:hypothetical protein